MYKYFKCHYRGLSNDLFIPSSVTLTSGHPLCLRFLYQHRRFFVFYCKSSETMESSAMGRYHGELIGRV